MSKMYGYYDVLLEYYLFLKKIGVNLVYGKRL